MKIKIKVGYNEEKPCYLTQEFEIRDSLPIVDTLEYAKKDNFFEHYYVDCKEIQPDVYNNSDVFNYDYYELQKFNVFDYQSDLKDNEVKNDKEYIDYEYIAVKKEEAEED